MNSLGAIDLWILLGAALLTALAVLLLLWLADSREGRRLRRLLDRNWQPVFFDPYRPQDERPGTR